ncbi:MAG: histidine kinase [Ruminococcus sp.]
MTGFAKNIKSKRNSCLSEKISVLLYVIAALFLSAFLIYLCVIDNIEVYQSRSDSTFTQVQNYTCKEVQRDDAPIGTVKEYTFFLDKEFDNDTYLAFYTVHQYAEVYLDGELIYSLKPSEENSIVKTVGSNWTMLPIYREDAGKEVRIEITPVYESFRSREVEFLIGPRLSIFTHRLMLDLPQLILGMIAFFVGFVFVCLSLHLMLTKKYGKRLASLGIFSIMLGLWRLTDTRSTPFIIPGKPVLMFYISVTMLMLGIAPLIMSAEQELNRKSQSILNTCCIVASISCIVQIMLQVFGLADFRENLIVTHILIAVSVAAIIVNTIFDRIKFPEKYKKQTDGKFYLICIVGVLADLIYYYVKGNSSGLIFTLLTFVFFIIYVGISTILNYREQERQLAVKDKMIAENERQLAENRIAVMISQIKPHFMNNSLTSIAMLCEKDPLKAEEAIIHLAEYLRENMNSLKERHMVPFSTEISHVENYLYFEKLRFGDALEITYDIETTDFMVPPLSVQPLVENAVKHGLKNHDGKGAIAIKVRELRDSIEISVTDNGSGFDKGSIQNDKGDHIGLENVRQRQKMLAGADLNIDSIKGVGTNALITIPKENQNDNFSSR